jgi:NAD(P)-dependent dehydrogenase (short-subunit alcohol dehydrogenase family)
MAGDGHFLIFGGTGGIGSAIVSRLAGAGARVTAVARDAGRLEALAERTGCGVEVADLLKPEEVERAFASASARAPLDGAALCAGSILLKPAHLTTDAEWAETLARNLTAAFHVLRAGAKALRERGGSLLFFSSVAAGRGLPNHEAIAAAKAGVEGLVRAAAATYAPQLRVNAIAPGLVRTPLSEMITRHEASAKASAAMHPLKRIGEPDDIAPLACWLLGREASWVTGQIFALDGGLSSVQAKPGAA